MIEPIPWVELTIFWHVIIDHSLLRGIDFYTEVSHLSDSSALEFNLIICPSEHLNDGTFLPFFIITRGVYLNKRRLVNKFMFGEKNEYK